MAYIELPLIGAGGLACNGSFSISTAALGVSTDTYMLSMYHDDVSISALCSAAASVDIEICCCAQSVVLAGGGVWVPLPALTAVTNVAKIGSWNAPLTAVRANVKTNLAGTLSLSIKTDAPSR